MTVLAARRVGALLAALMATAGAYSLNIAVANAAPTTRYVATSGNDSENDCTDPGSPCATIVHAVEDEANSGDTVSIASGSYAESVQVTQSMTIVGAGATGAGRTTVSGDEQSGDTSITVRGIDSAPTVTIKDLDVSGNSDENGIVIDDASATIEDSVVANNDAEGIWVQQNGTAMISGTTMRGNGADGLLLEREIEEARTAAASAADGDPSATVTNSDLSNNDESGIDVEDGSASADHSTINGNAESGVDVEGGAGLGISDSTLDSNSVFGAEADGDAQLTLTKSTVSNSQPVELERGSAGTTFGGGVVAVDGASVDVDTSTIFGNTGQGILNIFGTVTVENSTISGTLKPAGEDSGSGGIEELPYGGIAVAGQETPSIRTAVAAVHPRSAHTSAKPDQVVAPSTTVTGTIDADNTALADCNTTNGAKVTDGGYNLTSDDSCELSATGSKEDGHAELGPLQDNGGPTKTLEPAKGSDAIDVVPSGSAGCVADATDQRGVSKPQGPKCDVGAVEADQPAVVISPDSLPGGTVGVAYHQTITATGGLGAPYVWSLAAGELPPGLQFSAAGVISGVPTTPGTYPFTVSVDDPTQKDYTIVIVAPAGPSTQPIANTGARVQPLASFGGLTIGLGVLMLFASGALARWARRYRRVH